MTGCQEGGGGGEEVVVLRCVELDLDVWWCGYFRGWCGYCRGWHPHPSSGAGG